MLFYCLLLSFVVDPQKVTMASLGSDVQSTSIELVSLIEDMKERSAELDAYILQEEEEKLRIMAEVKSLEARLAVVNDSLKRKREAKEGLDRVLHQTFDAFKGILDNSKQLLSTAKEESSLMRQRCDGSL
eukprot:gene4433-3232_t